MPVVAVDRTLERIAQAKNPRNEILQLLGDLEGMKPCEDLVIAAIYVRPEKTKGGIIRPGENLREDQYQGKVGLIVSMGPDCKGGNPEKKVGDWAVFDVKDGWQFLWNSVPCRAVPYDRIRLIVDNPEAVL